MSKSPSTWIDWGRDGVNSRHAPSLGYVVLYVNDVAASLACYEKAFGLKCRFFHDDNGQAYGELETGVTRLAFASVALATEHLQQSVMAAAPDKAQLEAAIALTTPHVSALYQRAVKVAATAMSEPATKPWEQTVAYARTTPASWSSFALVLPSQAG